MTSAVAATAERFGRIDILFNNAGICAYGLAHELTEEAVGFDARHQPEGRLVGCAAGDSRS